MVVTSALSGPDVVMTTAGAGAAGTGPDGAFRLFQGIPYATAPVGAALAAARRADPWTVVRDATKPGLRCVQDTRIDPGLRQAHRRGLAQPQRLDAVRRDAGGPAAGAGLTAKRDFNNG